MRHEFIAKGLKQHAVAMQAFVQRSVFCFQQSQFAPDQLGRCVRRQGIFRDS